MKNLKENKHKPTKGERRDWPKISGIKPTQLDGKVLECKKVTPSEINVRSKGIKIIQLS